MMNDMINDLKIELMIANETIQEVIIPGHSDPPVRILRATIPD